MSSDVTNKGRVSRKPPQVIPDTLEGDFRLGSDGSQRVESLWPTDHLLVDEGRVMVATTLPGATALQLGILAAYSAIVGGIELFNSAPAGSGIRIFPRFLRLAQSVAPTSGIDLRYAIAVDKASRQPTTISNGAGGTGPGTPATATAYRAPVVCTNEDEMPPIYGVPYFPLSTAGGVPPAIPAAGAEQRIIVGNAYVKNSIPVVKDQYVIQFGGVDRGGTFQAAAALAKIVEHAPGFGIGPQQWGVIHLWSASNITAGNAWDDVSLEWVEK